MEFLADICVCVCAYKLMYNTIILSWIIYQTLLNREVTFWIHPDLNFLQGLLDTFPFASDDLEARSAIWNIMARLLFRIRESEMSPSALHQYVLVLASKCDQIEDDLLESQLDCPRSNARTTAVSSFGFCRPCIDNSIKSDVLTLSTCSR